MDENGSLQDEKQPASEFPLLGDRWEEAIADRLREAVRRAGGNKVVSEQSGIPLKTLGAYLHGRGMKLGTLLTLALTCGFSIEWLVEGKAEASKAEAAPHLFSIVDMDLMAAAIDGANAVFSARNAELRGRDYARLVCLIYDEAKDRIREHDDATAKP